MTLDPHNDEQAVRDVLHASMEEITAPRGVEDGARRLGRRMRTRRRLGIVAAGGVAAAALVVATPMAMGGGDDPRHADTAVATDPSTDASAPPAPATEWWTMPASEMVETLSELLPSRVRLSDPVTTNTDRAPGEPRAELKGWLLATLTGPGGPGKVNVVLSGDELDTASFTEGETRYNCGPAAVNDPKTCTIIREDDGRVVGRVIDAWANGVRDLSITLVTPDNGTVMVSVANTVSDKWPDGASPSAPQVPLTPGQLWTIAENPVWTSHQP